MRFLFDQNISHRILHQLPEQFAGSTSVKNEGLINTSDWQVWEFAKKNDYIIITQDSDFNDLNTLYGYPPKIIWIRSGNLKTRDLIMILINHIGELEKFTAAPNLGCFEIIRYK